MNKLINRILSENLNFHNGDLNKEFAYISYLLSYFLLIVMTPPFSYDLAIMYAKEAINYDDSFKYKDWLSYVLAGN